jgi:hypothetical protein
MLGTISLVVGLILGGICLLMAVNAKSGGERVAWIVAIPFAVIGGLLVLAGLVVVGALALFALAIGNDPSA